MLIFVKQDQSHLRSPDRSGIYVELVGEKTLIFILLLKVTSPFLRFFWYLDLRPLFIEGRPWRF